MSQTLFNAKKKNVPPKAQQHVLLNDGRISGRHSRELQPEQDIAPPRNSRRADRSQSKSRTRTRRKPRGRPARSNTVTIGQPSPPKSTVLVPQAPIRPTSCDWKRTKIFRNFWMANGGGQMREARKQARHIRMLCVAHLISRTTTHFTKERTDRWHLHVAGHSE